MTAQEVITDIIVRKHGKITPKVIEKIAAKAVLHPKSVRRILSPRHFHCARFGETERVWMALTGEPLIPRKDPEL